MRLSKGFVKHLSRLMVETLQKKGMIEPPGDPGAVVGAVEKAMIDDLSVEDRLNAEVREILKAYEAEIERGRLDYHTLFSKTKQKLARERDLVL
ncbi:MAG: DUF507 family protein [Nitrospirae bacterium]|nr:DUF507 family protein [Nitrospirota bacterium]